MTLILAIILYSSLFFFPEGESNVALTFYDYAYGVVFELLVIILFYSSFSKTEYSKSVEKSGWFCLLIWSMLNSVFFTWFGSPILINYIVGFAELFIFIAFFLYSQFRSYDIKSDEYDIANNYVVFKRPKTILGFFFSCVWSPVSSVFVVSGGFKYGYKTGKLFNQYNYVQKEHHILIKINKDTDEIKNVMESHLKDTWTFKTNCCFVVQQLFPNVKFNEIRDRLPCYFINTIIKNRA